MATWTHFKWDVFASISSCLNILSQGSISLISPDPSSLLGSQLGFLCIQILPQKYGFHLWQPHGGCGRLCFQIPNLVYSNQKGPGQEWNERVLLQMWLKNRLEGLRITLCASEGFPSSQTRVTLVISQVWFLNNWKFPLLVCTSIHLGCSAAHCILYDEIYSNCLACRQMWRFLFYFFRL